MIILLVGPSFSGKTYLLREWLLPTLLRRPHDVTTQLPARFRGALVDDPTSPSAPHGQYPDGVRYRDVAAWRAAEQRSRLSCFDNAEPAALLSLGLNLSETLLVFDEIDRVFPPTRSLTTTEDQVVQRGRHHGVALVGTCRRLHNVHRNVRGNVQVAYFAGLPEPDDRRYAAKMASVDETLLSNLPPHTFVEHVRGTDALTLIKIEGGKRIEIRDLRSERAA